MWLNFSLEDKSICKYFLQPLYPREGGNTFPLFHRQLALNQNCHGRPKWNRDGGRERERGRKEGRTEGRKRKRAFRIFKPNLGKTFKWLVSKRSFLVKGFFELPFDNLDPSKTFESRRTLETRRAIGTCTVNFSMKDSSAHAKRQF